MKTISLSHPTALLLAAVAALLGGGCANYHVTVDAIARSDRPAGRLSSYRIRSGNTDLEGDTLLFKEASAHVKTALSAHGLWEAPDIQTADMLIDLDFGVGPPQAHFEDIEVSVLPPMERDARPPENQVGGLLGSDSADPPQTTFEPALARVTLHEKHLTASCHANRPGAEGRPPLELWRIDVSIDDESADLREYLPILATVVMTQVGTNTNGLATHELSKTDDAIRFVKNGLP